MHIMLMTDGSACAEGAAGFLAGFNFSSQDEITVIHAIQDVPFDNRDSYYAGLKQVREEIAPRILDLTTDKLKRAKAAVHAEFVEGHPDEAILARAVQSDVDLIAMGGRGTQSMRSFLIGNVTRSVSINALRSIFVIKQPQWQKSGPLKILFATDGSNAAGAAGKLLASIPFPEGSEVFLLHVSVSAYMDIPERFTLEVDDKIKNIVAHTREEEYRQAETMLKEARTPLIGKFQSLKDVTRSGNPPEEILHVANEIGADVIAVGSSGMRGVKGMLGSVSRNILGHAECSVLIAKQKGADA